MTRTARATRAVLTPMMVVLTLTATGCPWDKADDVGRAAPSIEEYVGRILRGEKPSAVIADADQFGADFKAAVAAQAAAARRA